MMWRARAAVLRAAVIALAAGCWGLADVRGAASQPFPSAGTPNPAMIDARSDARSDTKPDTQSDTKSPAEPPSHFPPEGGPPAGRVPRPESVASTTTIPACTVFVDAAARAGGTGSAQSPHKTIAAAIAAAPAGAVICVAEGVYREQLRPGEKYFTLAGGFRRGSKFTVRNSARFVSKAQGPGSGSFLRVDDPGPKAGQLTAIDGFEITGYAQAIFRDVYYSQRFDITNNLIHGNKCGDDLTGAGVALNNVSGRIQGNVFRNNSCGRGGALSVNDSEKKKGALLIADNVVDDNHGTEPGASHGGAFYLLGGTLTITGNLFTNNSVTQWGGGMVVAAWTEAGQFTTAKMSWNVYRGNRAGNGGGGFFCDDGATCISEHEIYDRNCGGNVLLDGGGGGPTKAHFNFMTNVGALEPDCTTPGPGVRIDKTDNPAPDSYSFTNSLFWGNAPGIDFRIACDLASDCRVVKVSVSHSMVQTKHVNYGNVKVVFGPGIVAPADPLFADPGAGDLHLKSARGRWTPAGYVRDAATSPLLAKADPDAPADANPERAGRRNELGAYGNSTEASYTR